MEKEFKQEKIEKTRVQQNWDKVRNIFKNRKKQEKIINSLKNQKYVLFEKEIIRNENYIQTIYFLQNNQNLTTYTPTPKVNQIVTQNEAQVDTTGYWVWQAEQILAYYLFVNSLNFSKYKKFLELGAGTSGLAGLVYSLLNKNAQKVLITDGKSENIPYLQKNIKQNNLQKYAKGQILVWNNQLIDNEDLKYDLIVAADCLFFQKYHLELIQTLKSYLRFEGVCIFVNPCRGKSMKNFLKLLEQSQNFTYQYDTLKDQKYVNQVQKVSKSSEYKEEQDKYFFILVKKCKQKI